MATTVRMILALPPDEDESRPTSSRATRPELSLERRGPLFYACHDGRAAAATGAVEGADGCDRHQRMAQARRRAGGAARQLVRRGRAIVWRQLGEAELRPGIRQRLRRAADQRQLPGVASSARG